MAEANAAAAPAPTAAPTSNPDAQPGQPAPEARKPQRIVLADWHDDDQLVSMIDGAEHVEPVRDWRRNYQQRESATRIRSSSSRASG